MFIQLYENHISVDLWMQTSRVVCTTNWSSAVSFTLVKKNINEPQSAFWVQNKKLLSTSTITEINQKRPKSELVLGNKIQIYDSIHVC